MVSLAFLALFAVKWVLLGNLIGWMSGWWAVARHYRARERFEGFRLRNASGRLSWCHFNRMLTIGVNAHGLHLAPFFAFRCGLPPLFVPWTDVSATARKGWIFHYLDFHFAAAPGTTLSLKWRLGTEIARLANRSWDESGRSGPASGVA